MALKFSNPVGFLRWPVTLVICGVYIALCVALLYMHHVVPSAPTDDSPVQGVNLTEAWRDLQAITGGFHPFNSHKNDVVREYLLTRIDNILNDNGVEYTVEDGAVDEYASSRGPAAVTIFNDLQTNVSISLGMTSTYFESTNIIVYIRGSEDDDGDWWRDSDKVDDPTKKGVLVNAHYDSVSTGLGATDDGVGVVCILQLLKYYTTSGQQPRRGLVALLNNGEEDFLNGAYVFAKHPIAKFPNTFLNLEGAGAGGRAVLFRSTDAEVTQAYANSPYPFGTVLSSDAFSRGFIRSQTDYVVFNGQLGMRGLDVAFFEPRSRYHTVEDSAKRTSRDSIWHMLSAALVTTKALTDDTESEYKPDGGSRGVWFDLFGRTFGLTTLQTLFGLSVSLLVVTPLVLIALSVFLRRLDKSYLFARKANTNPLDPHSPDETVVVEFGGWKGLTRFPIAFVLASAAVAGLALLVVNINPLIVYSSPYSVWSMMLSAWFVVAWFFLRGADFMRPSALQRAHSLGWIFFIMWVLLVISTAAENTGGLASVYPVVIYFAAVFVALLISHLELLALPKKQDYVEASSRTNPESESPTGRQRGASISDSRPQSSRDARQESDEPTETSSLLGSARRSKPQRKSSHLSTATQTVTPSPSPAHGSLPGARAFGEEQPWSAHLPSYLWLLEFLILAPIVLIILGPIALFLTSSLYQTLADGNSPLPVYAALAVFSILLSLPTAPFLHRLSSRIPLFLCLILLGTTLYNVLAFPFSAENRLKVFFRQELDLDTGISAASLTGIDGCVQDIIAGLPSAAGRELKCSTPILESKKGLVTCRWPGLPPNVAPSDTTSSRGHTMPEEKFKGWMSFNATRLNGTAASASFSISGENTRSCRLTFDDPVETFSVAGSAASDPGSEPTRELRLWSRTWDNEWKVRVRWSATEEERTVARQSHDLGAQKSAPYRILNGTDDGGKKKKKGDAPPKRLRRAGRATCLWNDEGVQGTVPALDEVKMFMPVWSIVTKLDDGLVLGSRAFEI